MEVPGNLESLRQPGWRALAKIIVQSLKNDDSNQAEKQAQVGRLTRPGTRTGPAKER